MSLRKNVRNSVFLSTIFHAVETVLLITGALMLIRSAFQYGQRTGDWHHISLVVFNAAVLSRDELRWRSCAIICLLVGFVVKFSSLLLIVS
ncbi:hypothetical protein A8L45_09025 [Veronia pacifica]|uniref:Uncharacterized protein n=1 Tax=Veronia pacifica TaxID=1080227 RepID=A0A1C3EKK3_9GAMM|nr:hypothetical protein A8L45_09025 [Veronia pacifica]